MPARLGLVLLVVSAIAAAGLVAVIATAGSGGAPISAAGFAGALRPAGIPAANFTLADQEGRATSLRSYRGRVVVLTFLYSTCQDTCPLTAQQIRGALDDVGHDVPALAVSVDPRNDTEANTSAFLRRQHLLGRMLFLRGSAGQLAPVWREYGIQPQGGASEHSAYVLLLDRAGRQRIGFPVAQLTPEALAHDIRRLEAERRV